LFSDVQEQKEILVVLLGRGWLVKVVDLTEAVMIVAKLIVVHAKLVFI
jgi:hypothetical protein